MAMQQQTAKLNYLRIAPRKVRSVADLIRGMSVNEAEAQLSWSAPALRQTAFETLAFGGGEC